MLIFLAFYFACVYCIVFACCFWLCLLFVFADVSEFRLAFVFLAFLGLERARTGQRQNKCKPGNRGQNAKQCKLGNRSRPKNAKHIKPGYGDRQKANTRASLAAEPGQNAKQMQQQCKNASKMQKKTKTTTQTKTANVPGNGHLYRLFKV